MANGMRMMGLDVGERRIGVAVSDKLCITAQSRGYIERKKDREALEELKEIIKSEDIKKLVVGLPVNMDGSEGASARKIRVFSELLAKRFGLPVELWDERLTTAEADKLMKSAGMSRKKRSRRLDAVSAQLILQSYLDGLSNPPFKVGEKTHA